MLKGRILVVDHDGTHVLKFLGDVRLTLCPALDQYLDNIFNSRHFKTILIDLTDTQGIDSTSLGMLAKMSIRMKKQMGFVPTLVSVNDNITRVLLSMGFDKVFVLVKQLDEDLEPMQELAEGDFSDLSVQQKVLEAHRTLMGMNQKNHQEFKNLVDVLESQCVI
ncbi:MAG: STAS domain-containing protein [Oceanospirillaceae bacterium]|jgi:anti-anti-sigma factor|nr:STAS domain-containing protein [Oceanospirillaceae bacterium]MBT6077257.1 STAS domain-containing protein [Oceanospirillaceae bacterium]MBT7329641.1 STAS domain-containing protein [Oceanospirillaceae bacterium]